MNSTAMILTEVKSKYPSQAQKVEELFENNKEFRSICLDYSYCQQSISRLKQDYVDKKDAITDFEQLLINLEDEMKSFLLK